MNATIKTVLIAGSALALSISAASAASMAKAGMDKRVADLEREITLMKSQMKQAMMAKAAPDKTIVSGNSRVKVTLYGWVNRAVRFASSGDESQFDSIENNESPSRLGIRAVGALNKNTSAVALAEFGMSAGGDRYSTGFDGTGSDDDQGKGGQVSIRHSVISLSNKDLGTLSLGHSVRADASAVFTHFNGTNIAVGFGTLDPTAADGKTGRVGNPGNVNPSR